MFAHTGRLLRGALLILLCFTITANGLEVLLYSFGMSSSHAMFTNRFAVALTTQGHHVTTFLAPTRPGVKIPKFPNKEDLFEVESEEVVGNFKKMEQTIMRQIVNGKSTMWQLFNMPQAMHHMMMKTCSTIANDTAMRDRIRKHRYDVVVFHCVDTCLLGLINQTHNATVICLSAGNYITDLPAMMMAIPSNPSYIPHFFSAMSDIMTFPERMANAILQWTIRTLLQLPVSTLHQEMELLRRLTNSTIASFNDIAKPDGLIMNGEQFIDFPRPMLHDIIYMGNLESSSKKELSEEWRHLLNESNNGIIIFSLGSVVQESFIKEEIKNGLLKAFQKFPEHTIVWKLNDPTFLKHHTLPPHVHAFDWIPQRQLLNSQKVKLFITHGGYNSLLEITLAGVPMILIPLFGDQSGNVARAVRHRLGVQLPITKITADTVEEKMRLVLGNDELLRGALMILLCFTISANGLEVLLYSFGMSSSHAMFTNRFAVALTTQGHHVTTFLGPTRPGVKIPKFPNKEDLIVVESEEIVSNFKKMEQTIMRKIVNGKSTMWQLLKLPQTLHDMMVKTCSIVANDTALRDRIRRNHYDVVVSYCLDTCVFGLIDPTNKASIICLSAGNYVTDLTATAMAIPSNPSYIPHLLSATSDIMTFPERIVNAILQWTIRTLLQLPVPALNEEMKLLRRLTNSTITSFNDLAKPDGLIMNGEQFVDFPRPMLHDVIYMGNLESASKKELSEEWLNLLNESNKGIIVFALGSVVKESFVEETTKEGLLKAFQSFPEYTVVWKLDDPTFLKHHSLPQHVHAFDWIPQRQLLNSQKVKLFITHGGYNSLLEITLAGVPMILIPLFGDQPGNVARAVRHRLGVQLRMTEITADTMEEKMRLVLGNDEFVKHFIPMQSGIC
ncbi:UDP-glucoronosyl and UDP-glucosyl transferase [Trichuris suis]|nr:UDP-glucoronosyl and UDP-glucosyl transferase [Trichuris suis]